MTAFYFASLSEVIAYLHTAYSRHFVNDAEPPLEMRLILHSEWAATLTLMGVVFTFVLPWCPGPAGWAVWGDLEEQSKKHSQHTEGHIGFRDLWQSEVPSVRERHSKQESSQRRLERCWQQGREKRTNAPVSLKTKNGVQLMKRAKRKTSATRPTSPSLWW